jgi:chromosome segregation ATPase
MSTSTTPATPKTTQETAHLEKLRAQINTDIEAMQQKEASLKEYEQRLRMLMDHNQQGQPAGQANQVVFTAGPNSQQALDAEWEKYNRAHALLEAARRGLTDDRLAFKEREERLAQREKDVARREAWIKAREQELTTQAAAKVVAEDSNPSFVTSPLRAARKMLGPKKGTEKPRSAA